MAWLVWIVILFCTSIALAATPHLPVTWWPAIALGLFSIYEVRPWARRAKEIRAMRVALTPEQRAEAFVADYTQNGHAAIYAPMLAKVIEEAQADERARIELVVNEYQPTEADTPRTVLSNIVKRVRATGTADAT